MWGNHHQFIQEQLSFGQAMFSMKGVTVQSLVSTDRPVVLLGAKYMLRAE